MSASAAKVDVRFVCPVKVRPAADGKMVVSGEFFHLLFFADAVGRVDCFKTI